MLKTIILLIVALVVLPLTAYYLDPQFTEVQWRMIRTSGTSALVVATLCFVLAELTRNCSQVDKIWSVVPILYVWQNAYIADWSPRLVLMSCLVTLWGMRLTYNFSRRGAYSWKFWSGEEDYRWEILRKNPLFNTRLKWTLFNLLFISFYQNILIWLFTTPTIYATVNGASALGWKDFVVAGIFIALLIVETVADQQQWNFQNEKHRRIRNNEALEEPYSKGFVHTGLWSIVRHPNYFSEQSMWVVFYLFTVVATGHWLNGSLVGAVLLILLFQGSADFSEGISAEKYPAYKEYQKSVGRFMPKMIK